MTHTIEFIQQIAFVAHEANRAWCKANGDLSQPAWNDAPDWQVQSAIAGVNFHLQNPTATDSASHNNWVADKVKDGWKYGPVKDPVLKLHPCIVPFTGLPKVDQMKDKLFRGVVNCLLEESK